MGTLTFVELQDEVRSGLGGRTDLDSRLGRIVNLSQQRLARLHDFDDLETVSTIVIADTSSDNDKYITLPAIRELYSTILLDGAQSRKLTQRSQRYWDTLIPKPEYWSRARPRQYMIWGNTVELHPLPNATYDIRLRWTKWPNTLTGSDLSEFLQKDELLIELSLAYAYRSLGKEEDAAKHETIAMRLLEESKSMDNMKPDLDFTPHSEYTEAHSSDPWLNPFIKESL